MTDAERLCLSCGLCCDGTLFDRVPMTTDEVAPARAAGLRVLTREDGSCGLQQPCRALQSSGCSAYAARPGPCRTFRCMLLIALEERDVDLPEALETIARLKAAPEPAALIRQHLRREH